jgi:hypothetical protein
VLFLVLRSQSTCLFGKLGKGTFSYWILRISKHLLLNVCSKKISFYFIVLIFDADHNIGIIRRIERAQCVLKTCFFLHECSSTGAFVIKATHHFERADFLKGVCWSFYVIIKLLSIIELNMWNSLVFSFISDPLSPFKVGT